MGLPLNHPFIDGFYGGLYDLYGGFHKWRYPSSWMVYFRENPSING